MEANAEKIVQLIDKSRKILIIVISAIVLMIFIRGCINQMYDYKEEIEYLKESLINFHNRLENSSNCYLSNNVDEAVYNAQKKIITMMHHAEFKKSGTNKQATPEPSRMNRYDFALEEIGGRIVSFHDTKLMYECGSISLLLGKCYKINPPEKAIQSAVMPGEAFCFQGNQGSITIKLSCDILIDSLTIEHIDPSLTPNWNVTNAPKFISITGMQEKHDPYGGHDYGNFTFNPNISNSQTFHLEALNKKYQFIKINITENHGNQNQTCLYRIQVHGHNDEC